MMQFRKHMYARSDRHKKVEINITFMNNIDNIVI